MPAGLEGRVQPRRIKGFPVFCGSQSTAEAQRCIGRVWLAELSVPLASCRQLKLFCRRLREASAPFSVADKFIQRVWNVPMNGYGRDALPHASVLLPFAKLAGARASTPAETILRLTLLHHHSHWSATSTRQKDLKPIKVTGSHCGQDGRAPIYPGA